MKPLVFNAVMLLEDAVNYLVRISDLEYAAPIAILSGASISQHTRHILEFYQCLMEKLQPSSPPEKRILNYEDRKRDKRMESSAQYTIGVVEDLIMQLSQLPEEVPDIQVIHPDPLSGTESLIPSSLERELFYNIEHTIHHFALIRIGLSIVSPYIELPQHFGVAPSTLRYRQNKLALAG